MSANQLEQSMSYIERTAKKIYPILKELKKRLIPDQKHSKQSPTTIRHSTPGSTIEKN